MVESATQQIRRLRDERDEAREALERMSDGAQVVADLEDLTSRLDKASRELYSLQEEFAALEEQYDDALNDLLTQLLEEYANSDKRLPGEDVRNAIVTKRLRESDPLLFGNYRRKKAELDRGERRAKRIERQIDSKRSTLSWLKTEAQAIS